MKKLFVYSAFLILGLLPQGSQAALLYLDPETGSYGPSDTIIMSVRLDNQDECVNAITAVLEYDKTWLRAVDWSRGNSIMPLWIDEPLIDEEAGKVVLSGGIPGGYCGRVPGDPEYSNVIGQVILSVLPAAAEAEGEVTTEVKLGEGSEVLLNDGLGTTAALTTRSASLNLLPTPQQSGSPWLSRVQEDDIPPEAFDVTVEYTPGFFNGSYFAVFSTVDKQSGLSHFEIFKDGIWEKAKSPLRLDDKQLEAGLSVKALDKAGNERLGQYDAALIPERPLDLTPWVIAAAIAAIVLVALTGYWLWRRRRKNIAYEQITPTL